MNSGFNSRYSIMVPADKDRFTHLDYAQLPEGAKYQLIDGDLIMTPSAGTIHPRVCARIGFELQKVVIGQNLGEVFFSPTDVYFGETETFQPDIFFISNQRLSIVAESRIEGAPDLVAEVLSPSTGYFDLTHKKNVYESFGVAEYWIVDPIEKTIDVFQRRGDRFGSSQTVREKGVARSTIIKDFFVDAESLFQKIAV